MARHGMTVWVRRRGGCPAGAVVGALAVVTTWRRQEQLAGLRAGEPEHRRD